VRELANKFELPIFGAWHKKSPAMGFAIPTWENRLTRFQS
jgi:hypothetical protein